jgi:hypothetical protein
MALPEHQVPLDEASLLISATANDGLGVEDQLVRLDGIAGRVVRPGWQGVSQILFEDLGLRGDHATYDDPANSYLDRVLDRRL